MKRLALFILTIVAALAIGACTPAENKPANVANVNTNTAPPAPAAPTADSLLALDKQANDAWKNHDTKFFETFLNDKFIGFGPHGRWDRNSAMKDIAEHKCNINSINLDEPKMSMVGSDVAVLVYKATYDGTCEGKKINPARAASVFIRKGDKWLGAYHSETDIVEPKSNPAADKKGENANAKPTNMKAKDEKSAELKKDNKAASATAEEAPKVPADAKKTAMAPSTANMKKEPANAKSSANTNSMETKGTGTDDVTAALMAVEKAGWEAWKARDQSKLEEWTTGNLMFVDFMGMAFPDKSSTIKTWIEPKCDIKTVNVSDGQSISLTPEVAILTYKGTGVGTCEGQKLSPVWAGAVFMKEGDTWKLAFMIEKPA